MTMSCAEFRDVAPELALGIAVGDERAAALDHLAGCPACRRELDRLTASVDAVVATAPDAEPSSGFEVRALASFEAAPARPHRRFVRVLATAAAVIAVVAVLGLGAAAVVRDDGGAPAELGYRSRDAAALIAPDGAHVGSVRVQRTPADGGGTRSELVVAVDGAPAGTYRVQCDYESGRPYAAGELAVGTDGLARWSTTVGVPTYDLRRVRLVSTNGAGNLEAEFPA